MDSEYIGFLRERVTPETLEHCHSVMHEMGRLSEVYHLDYDTALITGLLHDIAKDIEPEKMLLVAKKAKVTFRHACEKLPLYLHGPVGASVVKKDLHIKDRTVVGAIAKHTFCGRSSLDDYTLTWCLRFADVLAPTNPWKGMKKLKGLVYGRQWEKAILLHCRWLSEYLEENGLPVHPNIIRIFDGLHEKLEIQKGFFSRL